MAKSKRSGKGWDLRYDAYKRDDRAKKNKIRDIEKHIARNPNDKQAPKMLERILTNGFKFRCKPKHQGARWNTLLPCENGRPDPKKIGKIKTKFTDGKEPSHGELFIQVLPTCNRLSGSLSSAGKEIQQMIRFVKANSKTFLREKTRGMKSYPKGTDVEGAITFASESIKNKIMNDFNVNSKSITKSKKVKSK